MNLISGGFKRTADAALIFSASMVMILMPGFPRYIPPFMILWGLTWAITFEFPSSSFFRENKTRIAVLVLMVLLYIWQMAGIIYSDDRSQAWKFTSIRLSLLIFPLIISFSSRMLNRNGVRLLRIFSASTFAFIVICLFYALYRSVSFTEGAFVFNHHPKEEYWVSYFTGRYLGMGRHTSYLAFSVLLSALIAFETWYDRSLRKSVRLLWMTGAIILSVAVYLLSSRSGILVLAIVLPAYFLFRLRHKTSLYKLAAFGAAVTIILALILGTNNRIKLVYSSFREGKMKEAAMNDDRVIIWNAALRIIKDNPVIGVGSGDVEKLMKLEYNKTEDQELNTNYYNVHNQYLEIWVENGIIGLILFIAMLSLMIYIAISERNLIYLLFLMSMIFFFLFETVLNRFMGVSFFSLFSFLLMMLNTGKQASGN